MLRTSLELTTIVPADKMAEISEKQHKIALEVFENYLRIHGTKGLGHSNQEYAQKGINYLSTKEPSQWTTKELVCILASISDEIDQKKHRGPEDRPGDLQIAIYNAISSLKELRDYVTRTLVFGHGINATIHVIYPPLYTIASLGLQEANKVVQDFIHKKLHEKSQERLNSERVSANHLSSFRIFDDYEPSKVTTTGISLPPSFSQKP